MASARSPQIWETVERIRRSLQLSHGAIASLLQMSPRLYWKYRRRKRPPSLHSFTDFALALRLSVDSVYAGNIDFRSLRLHFRGKRDYLPERYQCAAFSRRRTSVYLLDYIERFHGWRARDAILRRFQLTEELLSDPDGSINIRFLTDLCKYLRETGVPDHEFVRMGSYSVITNRNTPLGKLFASFRHPYVAYERLFSGLIGQYYDENFQYRLLRMNSSECLMEARQNQDVASALGLKALGSRQTCDARLGAMLSLPGYLSLPYSKARKLACQHEGDSTCRYFVDFSEARRRYDEKRRRQSDAVHT